MSTPNNTNPQGDEHGAPVVHRVHAERSYDQRAHAIIAFNKCDSDLDDKLEAAWLATLKNATLHPSTLLSAAQPVAQEASKAVQHVLAERRRQVEQEGWTPDHDDDVHNDGDLSSAASSYALAAADRLNPLSQGDGNYTRGTPPSMWPEDWTFKPADPRRMLVKAGALILAEIERLDRKEANHWKPCARCDMPDYCTNRLRGCDREEISK